MQIIYLKLKKTVTYNKSIFQPNYRENESLHPYFQLFQIFCLKNVQLLQDFIFLLVLLVLLTSEIITLISDNLKQI